jgi:hypothetical protein
VKIQLKLLIYDGEIVKRGYYYEDLRILFCDFQRHVFVIRTLLHIRITNVDF